MNIAISLIDMPTWSGNRPVVRFQIAWKFGSRKQTTTCAMIDNGGAVEFKVQHRMPWGYEWGPLSEGATAGFFGEAGTITAEIKAGKEVLKSGTFGPVELMQAAAASLSPTRQIVKIAYQIEPKYSAEEKAALIARVLAA